MVLSARRADGTVTWQVHEGPRAMFFPLHDLTHLAVERALGTRDGFFGLIAAGWDIADTGGKGARGPLPAEAGWVERVVGLMDRDGIGGAAPLTAADINAILDTAAGGTGPAPHVTATRLEAIRQERSALHAGWADTPAGKPYRLVYQRPAVSAWLAR